LKYVYLMVWWWLGPKLAREYGVFQHSVGILLWSFVAAMLVLAGAEWAARREIRAGE
jgi:membrane protein/epoxyqueuosine reductase